MGKMSELSEELREQKAKAESGWYGHYKPEVVGKSDNGEDLTDENLSSDDYIELWRQKHGLDDEENSDEDAADEEQDENEDENELV